MLQKQELPSERIVIFQNNFLQWLAQLKNGQVGLHLHQQHPQGVLLKHETSPLLSPTAGHRAEEEKARTGEKRREPVDL